MELGKLSDLIKLLRDSGVESYRNGDLELVLGAAPATTSAVEEDIEADKSAAADELAKLPGIYSKAFSAVSDGSLA